MAITLDTFFELGNHADRMHPTALKEYQQFIDDLSRTAPLDIIAYEDVERLLSDLDNWNYKKWLKGLEEWLTKCLASNSGKTPPVYPGALPYWSSWWIKRLLKKVGSLKREELALAAARERIKARAIQTEARKLQEEKEKTIYVEKRNAAIEKFKEELAMSKKPAFSSYATVPAKYHPGSWCELESPTEIELDEWAAPRIRKKTPQILREYISWDLDWWTQTIPYYARYEVIGVPCLIWCFKRMLILEAHLKLEERRYENYGLGLAIKVKVEHLGSTYFGPLYWDDEEGFTTPIALLGTLAEGKLEGDGIELIEHDKSVLVFAVRGFDNRYAEIHEGFRQFITDTAKDKNLAEGLLAKDLIDEITAQLLAEKVLLPLPAVKTQNNDVQFTGNGEDLIAALQVMGYQTQEIKDAIDSADLSPTIPFEKKVAAVIEILDKNIQ
jgi:hypothetical protein